MKVVIEEIKKEPLPLNHAVILRDDLMLGVATAATQIEGGDKHNTWYKYSEIDKKIKDGSSSLRANNFYNKYLEYLQLMKEMNIKFYRFSIEWARVEPIKGVFNIEAIQHYKDELTTMSSFGIKPLLTLHHFSNPLWFDELGGFEKKGNLKYFYEFVERIIKDLKGLVNEFCTFNEPNVYAANGYFFGDWPPEKKSFSSYIKVMRNYGVAHINTYKIIKRIIPNSKVGFAFHFVDFESSTDSSKDKFCTNFISNWFQNALFNFMMCGKGSFPFLLKYKKGDYSDFIGVNYYRKLLVKGFATTEDPTSKHNDLGWSSSPHGLNQVLHYIHSLYPKKDVWITENGTADAKDEFRKKYTLEHLRIVNDNAFVSRYYHWTFLDNFEWKEGESAKFGLVEYNFQTGEYKVRQSGEWYKKLAENHTLE